MNKSVLLFSMLFVLSNCTNYPSNNEANREFIPYPDKALQEAHEKKVKQQEEIPKRTSSKDSI
jgi:hypothetical protein